MKANVESPLYFSWTNDWPQMPVPTNAFSARWSGIVRPQTQGDHVFYVSADAGAACRLRVNGATIIDNWAQPATNTVELAGTTWLGTNIAYDLRLEYAHFTGGAHVALSWLEPGMGNTEVIPSERLVAPTNRGPTGVSVDAAGKIWAGCHDSDTAVRIDPDAGPLVVVTNVTSGVTNVVTNHVGLVDMMVDLGNGTWHPSQYNVRAQPYNYSDMTGFNQRVVNPSLKPLKGYWIVVNDSGHAGQLWSRVSWNATNTAPGSGCSIEIYVRAADEREWLGSETYVPVTNNVPFGAIRGRYIEVRLGMTRDDPSKQPVLYDLTLHGVSSGFIGDYCLYDQWADEGSNAVFAPSLVGVEPMSYQWYVQYPWTTNLLSVRDGTNSSLTITNVDSWVDLTQVGCLVSNGNGEVLWLGPAYLVMFPAAVHIPAVNYPSGQGPATRYPMTINVFDQPTNLHSVVVTLWGLTHTHSADISLLLVSPSNKGIMLMSNVGGTNGVSSAGLSFSQAFSAPIQADPFLPPWPFLCGPSNYGQVGQMPQVGSDPPPPTHSANLDDLSGENPNGCWKLYIYDSYQGGVGQLTDSWQLNFDFQ